MCEFITAPLISGTVQHGHEVILCYRSLESRDKMYRIALTCTAFCDNTLK